MQLARFEGDLRSAADEPLTLAEFLDLLGRDLSADVRERQRAIACFLSGEDGWKEAVKQIGGAFADELAKSGLKDRQGE